MVNDPMLSLQDSSSILRSRFIFSLATLAPLEDLRLLDIPNTTRSCGNIIASYSPARWLQLYNHGSMELVISDKTIDRCEHNPFHALVEILLPIAVCSLANGLDSVSIPRDFVDPTCGFMYYGLNSLSYHLGFKLVYEGHTSGLCANQPEESPVLPTAKILQVVEDSFVHYAGTISSSNHRAGSRAHIKVYNLRLSAKRRSIAGPRLVDIKTLLHEYGFINVESLVEYSNPSTYADVESFIGIHGAFLPNLICSSGLSRVLEIFPESYVVPSNLCILGYKRIHYSAIYADVRSTQIHDNGSPLHSTLLRSQHECLHVADSVEANDYLYMRLARYLRVFHSRSDNMLEQASSNI